MDASALDTARERVPLVENEGKSGATLERVVLADGRRVIVKRFDPEHDLVMRLTGDGRGREVEMLHRGLFEQLPSDVGHAVLGGWFEDGYGVLVMRDLGEAPLSWDDRLDAGRCDALLKGVTSLHRRFHGAPPDGLTPIADVVGLFEPRRLAPYRGLSLVDYALRGWELWADLVPGEVGQRVLTLAQDTAPLSAALTACTPTFIHGDLAGVNLAFEDDALTLIDWGLAAAAPGAVDIGRFLVGCAHTLDVSPDDFLAMYRHHAADLYDDRATRLGLLSGLVWLGWNKSLDIGDHPDAAVRERERNGLAWWLARAAEGLEVLDG
ncbi:MAG TPA: hypothetical protein VFK41_04655 [Nocardioidaceae bacterium]|nr:hypothetical protein [Nocardioidaceae bacterium]